MRTASFVTSRVARAGRRAAPLTLAVATVALTALGGCSIDVNDGGHSFAGDFDPRSATDVCRREVHRSYEKDYDVTYELPQLTTTGATQTVIQPFIAVPEEGNGPRERLTVRCTLTNGALTEVTSLR